MPDPHRNLELTGIAVSGGSRVGRAVVFEETPGNVVPLAPPEGDPESEVQRLDRALEASREGLARLREAHGAEIGGIFRFHAALLEDTRSEVEDGIRAGESAEQSVSKVFHALAQRLRASGVPMLEQRARDVVDVERRLLRRLTGLHPTQARVGPTSGPAVVVARDLTPSEVSGLEGQAIVAIALEEGGATSHTSVIAKSLGIPCVVGVDGLTTRIQPGDRLWVDGTRGLVTIDPDPDTVSRAEGLGDRYARLEATLLEESHLPAETLDGHRAVLLSNVEFALDVPAGMKRGASGVGLFRTEFLYDGKRLPTEDEHVAVYRDTLERLGGGRLTIRTFDFGSDKGAPFQGPKEANPALGMRSLRWCFAHPEVFAVQLRAILRAAAEGDVRIMLPMVGSIEEIRQAKDHIRAAAADLAARGVAHRPDPPIGIMIEIPGAAVTADVLAREADFFSIGTNDLIQYDLAVDRVNARVAPLFRPSHPSLLRLLRTTIQAAEQARIPLTMCGEMGGHSIYTVLLFGMGIREFSLTPGLIPRARRLLRGLTLGRARSLAAQCLRLPSAEEVEALLQAQVTPVGAG